MKKNVFPAEHAQIFALLEQCSLKRNKGAKSMDIKTALKYILAIFVLLGFLSAIIANFGEDPTTNRNSTDDIIDSIKNLFATILGPLFISEFWFIYLILLIIFTLGIILYAQRRAG